jgi:GAF domain-containing protein
MTGLPKKNTSQAKTDASDLHTPTDEAVFAVNDWPMRLEDIREQLKKAQMLLEQYRAALRLARVEIERRNQSITTLTTFAYQASCVGASTTVVKLALARALEITNAPVGAIVLIDPETERLSLGIHKGLTTELSNILTGLELGAGAGAIMPYVANGAGALLEYASDIDQSEKALLTAGRVTSLVSLPLQVGSRLMGALLVGLQGKRRFRPTELRFIMAISQETAVALESLELRKELWRTAESLLDGKKGSHAFSDVDQTELNLEISSLTGFPISPSLIPQPAGDDLEQVLAAMMEAEAEVRQQNADLQILNTFAEMLNRTLNLKEILQCTVDQTRVALKPDAAWIYLINERNQLAMRAHIGLSVEYAHGMRRLALSDGLEGRVAAENKPYFVELLSDDAYGHKIWVEREGFIALVAVPITCPKPERQAGQANSQAIGVLAAGKRGNQAYHWSPREVRLLNSIANQVALAIDNARLYTQVQEGEVGMRASNQILREINDMLLEKNAFLEVFIQDNLIPSLTVSTQILHHLQAEDATPLDSRQIQEYVATLQGIASRLGELDTETGDTSIVLDINSGQAPSDEDHTEQTEIVPSPEGLEESCNGEPELMSLQQAVASGLVPGHFLSQELDC